MARSTYIYVVEYDPVYDIPRQYAAFTVKHELIAHLRRLTPSIADNTYVQRFRDNAPGTPVDLNVRELITEV